MTLSPVFPTVLHHDAAEIVQDYFSAFPIIDTVLVVNSCARGLAVPESDLDFAILVRPDAIFTISDRMAIGAMLAIKERGLTMPHDVGLVGFNNEPVTSLVTNNRFK